MDIFINQDKLKSILSTPIKMHWKEFFNSDSELTFFEKMISEFNFYLFLHGEIEPLIREEVLTHVSKRYIHIASFSFYVHENIEYFTLCYENFCLLFNTQIEESLNFMKEIFNTLTENKIYLISSDNLDYQRFESLINHLNEKNQTNIIQFSNICFPSNEEKAKISIEINEITSHINFRILQFPIFNITKKSILTFSIRKFFYKSKLFENPNFFNSDDSISRNHIKIHEFKNREFITLREISLNISLILCKKTNKLFVQKIITDRIPFCSFGEKKKLFNRINELERFVKFYGYTKTEQDYIDSLIIEFMANGTIQDCIQSFRKSSGQMNKQKFKIMIQIIEELNILHSNNIIHRDLKPDNIFIDHNNKIRIGDFDYTRFESTSEEETYTIDIGSLEYSSPEILNSSKYSKNTDIYSFGKILYFIIFGEKDNNMSEIKNILLQSIYEGCINIDPNKRLTIAYIACHFVLYSIDQYINLEFSYLFYLLKKDNPEINYLISSSYNRAFKSESMPEIELEYLFLILINLLPYYIANQKIDIILDYLIALSNKKNNNKAQNTLGYIYLYGLYTSYDIDKSIHYYSLSANQNDQIAQNMLGMIYYSKSYPYDINKAIHHFTIAANLKNKNAIEMLGLIYIEGIDVPRDANKAIYYFTKSANQNNTNVHYLLGVIYKSDDYVPHDTEKAIKHLTIAAKANNSNAYFELGMIYCFDIYGLFNINKAIYYLVEAAKRYNQKAEIMLGIIYIEGIYIPRDIDKGIYYLTLAANQNNSLAQSYLGYIYNSNQFVKRDINKAMYYFTISANQNDPLALFQLGMIYLLGVDIKRDINKAIKYLTNSANQNEQFAQYTLGYLYINGEYISKNIQKGIYYLTYSANNGNQFAQDFLGKFYLYDSSLFDINKAIHFLLLSANQHFIKSVLFLGYIYYSGDFVPRDLNKAIKYFKEASSMNNSYAKNNLGIIYKNGEGVNKNIYQAIEYFNEAIHLNNDLFSLYNLSRIYYFGIDVNKDVNKAINLLKKASDHNFTLASFILFLIYSFGEDDIKSNKKADEYKIIISQTNIYLNFIFNYDILSFQKDLFKLYQNFDLIYSIESHNINQYVDTILQNIFFIPKNGFDNVRLVSKSNKRNLDSNFYEGFDI